MVLTLAAAATGSSQPTAWTVSHEMVTLQNCLANEIPPFSQELPVKFPEDEGSKKEEGGLKGWEEAVSGSASTSCERQKLAEGEAKK